MLSKGTVKQINNLQQKKYRQEQGVFLVEGIKGVEEAILNKANFLSVIIEDGKKEDEGIQKIIELAVKNKIKFEFCGQKDIKNIKTTETFPGILAIIKQKNCAITDFIPGNIICLDGIRDPGNLGTIIRSADWFGIKNILLSEDCVEIYNPKVVRSTMGSIFRIKVVESGNILNDLEFLQKQKNYQIFSLTMDGKKLSNFKNTKSSIFVIGSESHGVREEIQALSIDCLTIPGQGQAESLNAAIATGILLYHINQ